ncbi:MAG: glycosyltransferase [Microgenomates group bacterium]
MIKKTLAFFDHAPHKVTKSTYFLRDVLKKNFKLTDMWDDSWDINDDKTIEEFNKFDVVLFFQELPEIRELRKIRSKIIWVPMYDAVVWWPYTKWLLLSTVTMKVISFSSTLADKLRKLNYDVLPVQFYVNPDNYPIITEENKINIFYWQRRNIDIESVVRKFKEEDVGEIWIKIWPDKGVDKLQLSDGFLKKYKVNYWTAEFGIDREKGYFETVAKCNVFVAPRKYEGIGWSIMEGMAMGMVLVAHDKPVMNEYIVNGINGFLIETMKEQITFEDVKMMGVNMKEKFYQGYLNWQGQQIEIANFIDSKMNNTNKVKYEDSSLFRVWNLMNSIVANFRFSIFLNEK